jgi:hypothetical protein
LVDFIHQTNEDLLERATQTTANALENSARVFDAIPLLSELPIDDALSFSAWLIDELLEEYRATVDEIFLQELKCDIYCLSQPNCTLDLQDVYNFFESKVDPSLSLAATTYADIISYLLTGTFIGTQYFFYMTYLQLSIAAMGSYFGRKVSPRYYAMVARAGNPDNDWAIFCLDCLPDPLPTGIVVYDFAGDYVPDGSESEIITGVADWAVNQGTFDGVRLTDDYSYIQATRYRLGSITHFAVHGRKNSNQAGINCKLYIDGVAAYATAALTNTTDTWTGQTPFLIDGSPTVVTDRIAIVGERNLGSIDNYGGIKYLKVWYS